MVDHSRDIAAILAVSAARIGQQRMIALVQPGVSSGAFAITTQPAASAGATDTNNVDVYGASRSELVTPCKDIFMDGFE